MYKKALLLTGALILLTSCGAKKADVPDSSETEITTETTAVAGETSAETTATAAETQPTGEAPAESDVDETTGNAFEGSGFVSFSIPEITVSMPDISLPDMSVPNIDDFLGEDIAASADTGTDHSETVTTSVTEEQTSAEPTETEITDSGFVFKGKVMEIGDDEHGYIMVPADSYKFYDATGTNMIQYAIDGPTNIMTIKHLPGVGSYLAAQGIMAGIDEKGIVQGLTGATVKLGDYDAYQIYGLYPDGVYEVIWVTEDKNVPDSSYYVCFELDAEHIDDLALASTYKMPSDHK